MAEQEADHGSGDEADEQAGDDAGVRPAGVLVHRRDENLPPPVGGGAHEEDGGKGEGDDDPAVEEGESASEAASERELRRFSRQGIRFFASRPWLVLDSSIPIRSW